MALPVPAEDLFERQTLYRAFLGVTLLILITSVVSVFSALLGVFPSSYFTRPVLALYGAGIAWNLSILLWLRYRLTPEQFTDRLPAVSLPVNFGISVAGPFLSAGSPEIIPGVFTLLSIIYLSMLGLFTRSVALQIVASGALMAAAFVILGSGLWATPGKDPALDANLQRLTIMGIGLASVVFIIQNRLTTSLLDQSRKDATRIHAKAYFDAPTGLPNALHLERDLADLDKSSPGGATVLTGIRIHGLEDLYDSIGFERTSGLLSVMTRNVAHFLDNPGESRELALADPRDRRLYRLDGNIFVAMVRGQTAENRAVAPRPMGPVEKFLNEEFRRLDPSGRLSFQGGVTATPTDAPNRRQLLANLSHLLHRQRTQNLGRMAPFDPSLFKEFQHRERIRESILPGLRQGQFRSVYQPKVEVTTGRVAGFEALARWQHPELGAISPVEFIPLVEDAGAMDEFTWQVLTDAFRFLRSLRHHRLKCRVSVNLSPVLLAGDWLERRRDEITRSGFGAHLEFEITEGTLMNLVPRVKASVSALRSDGVAFAIDDFGTGYSNLGYLQAFEADVLKIDKSFMQGLPDHGANNRLVPTMLQMARSFGMQTVAEGVEDEGQRAFLAEHDCDLIQGFLFSRPLEAKAAVEFLEARNI